MKMEILDLNNEEDTKTTDEMEPKNNVVYEGQDSSFLAERVNL